MSSLNYSNGQSDKDKLDVGHAQSLPKRTEPIEDDKIDDRDNPPREWNPNSDLYRPHSSSWWERA